MKSEILFTGTSSAEASLNRFHSSFVIQYEDFRILVDAGDGISKALLKSGIPFNAINSLLISHRHADHIAGLPSLYTQWKMNKRSDHVNLYSHSSDTLHIQNFLKSSYLFPERQNFRFDFLSFEDGISFCPIEDIKITAMRNSHLDRYGKSEDGKEYGFYSASFLIEAAGNKIFYTGDIGGAADFNLCPNSPDICIVECFHVSLEEIKLFITQNQGTLFFLTHCADDKLSELRQFAEGFQNGRVVLAEDGMICNFADKSIYINNEILND